MRPMTGLGHRLVGSGVYLCCRYHLFLSKNQGFFVCLFVWYYEMLFFACKGSSLISNMDFSGCPINSPVCL